MEEDFSTQTICYNCGQRGHFATSCKQRRKSLVSLEKTRRRSSLTISAYPKTPLQRQLAIARHLKSNKHQLLLQCHAVLKKPSKARTDSDLQLVVNFTATNAFFQDKFEHVGDSFHIELCRRIRHRNCKFDEITIQQGDIGNEFYIIISGAIRVELVKTVLDEKQKPQTLITLGPGDSFGELALLNEEPRAASCIVASLRCELMVIKKVDFVEILQKSHITTLLKRTRFLRRIPLFRTLRPQQLVVVASHMSKRVWGRHQIMIEENTHAEGLYVITKGVARVLKRCDDQVVQLSMLQVGDIFGELGVLLPGSKRTASVVGESTKVECLELSRSDFFEHLSQYQDLMLDECLSRYPTDREIINEIQDHQQWHQYKQSICSELGNAKNTKAGTMYNVPTRPPVTALRGRKGSQAMTALKKRRHKYKQIKRNKKDFEYYQKHHSKKKKDTGRNSRRGPRRNRYTGQFMPAKAETPLQRAKRKFGTGWDKMEPNEKSSYLSSIVNEGDLGDHSGTYTTDRLPRSPSSFTAGRRHTTVGIANVARAENKPSVSSSSSSSSSSDDGFSDEEADKDEEHLVTIRRNARRDSLDVRHSRHSAGTKQNAFTHILRHSVGKRFARRLSLKPMNNTGGGSTGKH